MAALLKSLRYLCLTIIAFVLCKDLLGPDFMVTVALLLAILLVLPTFMETVKPLLSEAGTIATAFLLTVPAYLWECLLVKFIGSVEKGLGQFLFFSKKAELLRVIAHAISEDMMNSEKQIGDITFQTFQILSITFLNEIFNENQRFSLHKVFQI